MRLQTVQVLLPVVVPSLLLWLAWLLDKRLSWNAVSLNLRCEFSSGTVVYGMADQYLQDHS
jgi:hypothetical protein